VRPGSGTVRALESHGTKPAERRVRALRTHRKTEARAVGILRHLLAAYDDVVYRAVADADAVVTRAAAGIDGGDRVFVRPFPLPALAAIA